jgi:hypothetical protein
MGVDHEARAGTEFEPHIATLAAQAVDTELPQVVPAGSFHPFLPSPGGVTADRAGGQNAILDALGGPGLGGPAREPFGFERLPGPHPVFEPEITPAARSPFEPQSPQFAPGGRAAASIDRTRGIAADGTRGQNTILQSLGGPGPGRAAGAPFGFQRQPFPLPVTQPGIAPAARFPFEPQSPQVAPDPPAGAGVDWSRGITADGTRGQNAIRQFLGGFELGFGLGLGPAVCAWCGFQRQSVPLPVTQPGVAPAACFPFEPQWFKPMPVGVVSSAPNPTIGVATDDARQPACTPRSHFRFRSLIEKFTPPWRGSSLRWPREP